MTERTWEILGNPAMIPSLGGIGLFRGNLLHIKITHFNSVTSVVITSVAFGRKCHKHCTSILPMSCV
jgi:hypothetical protein